MRHHQYISVIVFLFLSSFTLQAVDYVFISEIMYDTPLNEVITQSPYSNGEYVELYNAGYQSVDLTGWELLGEGVTERYVFSGVNIAPKSYLIVAYRHNQSSNFVLEDLYQGINPSANDATIYQNKVVLSNTKEYIRLKDTGGLLRDSIYYGNVTSIQPISARLIATNDSQTPGSDCVSVHRVTPVFDEMGCAIASHLQWTTGIVTPFGLHAGFEEPPISTIDYTTLSGHNYIITSVPKSETTSATPGSNGELTTIQYFDGLGRPIQTVQMGITPDNNDLVTYQEYDGFGRESNSWLPRVAEGNNGAFIDFESFVNLPKDIYNEDASPYSETRYEPSPLNRITEQYGPGFAWYNNNKRVITSYGTNDGSVACFHVDESGRLVRDGNYLPSTLYKTTVTDEDGKASCEYTDKLGQVVLKQAFNNGEKLNTYYVYNDLGQLSYVIPPIAADSLPNTTGPIYDNNGVLKRYAYLYKYDERGNQIYKRLPGCEPVLMVYDKANRLILSQDGNQKIKQQWLVNKYDVLGRLLYTGIIEDSLSHEDLIADLRDEIIIESWNTASDIDNTGYTCGRFTPDKLLTVNYYDNYNFVTLTDVNLDYDASKENEYGYKYPSAKGLLTGMRTYLLDNSGTYIATAQYYDYKGQVIQSRSSNHLGGHDITYNKYDFTGNLLAEERFHSVDENYPPGNMDGTFTERTEIYEHTYDHASRLIETKRNGTIYSTRKYNELGQLEKKIIRNGIDTINYTYNVRGWITDITGTHLKQKLYYHSGIDGEECYYNGNIAAMRWQNPGESVFREYNYFYDELNRLEEGRYNERGNGNPLNFDRFNETIGYDKHGNISHLERSGVRDKQLNGFTYGAIDNLSYTYYGNQLRKVNDQSGFSGTFQGAADFKQTSTDNIAYLYDPNGNLIKDKNKGIDTIHYNLLNLPEEIIFANGNRTRYLYDAGGTKRQVTNLTALNLEYTPVQGDEGGVVYDTLTYDYNGSYIYKDHYLNMLLTPDGYEHPSDMGTQQHYYAKDHLGSNRVDYYVSSMDPSTVQIREINNYYPYGMEFNEKPTRWGESTFNSITDFTYNGKEYQTMHGLNMLDYGARFYDPAEPQWRTVDPLGEKYYSWSSYVYCLNNPVKLVDPDGRDPKKIKDWKIFGKSVYNATTAVLTFGLQGTAKVNVGSFAVGVSSNPGSFDLIGIRDGNFTPNKNTPTIQSGGEVSLGVFSLSKNTTITDNGATTTKTESTSGVITVLEGIHETTTEIDQNTNEVITIDTQSGVKVSDIGVKASFILGIEIKVDMKKVEEALKKLINE